jgi:hypothetical protein
MCRVDRLGEFARESAPLKLSQGRTLYFIPRFTYVVFPMLDGVWPAVFV